MHDELIHKGLVDRPKKLVSFNDNARQEHIIPTVQGTDNEVVTDKEKQEDPRILFKRELTSLGNPWQVNSPALRQLCTVIPRKKESFGANLKVFKDGISLRRSYSVLRSIKKNEDKLKSKSGFHIYPVLSRITPTSLPGRTDNSEDSAR